jgi:geranylgeranyl diphosphate synthase type I
MKEDIEDALKKYFPKSWGKKHVRLFLGQPKYSVDTKALDDKLNSPIRDFVLRGGKRIRPVLFLTCLKLFGVNWRKYLDLAVLIELVHNGTLVLDDVEDNGRLRRGKPACHLKFGLDTAVNAGFSLNFLPLKLLLNKGKLLTDSQRLHIWKIYAEEMINVSFGQGLDIYWHKSSPNGVSVNEYLEMVRLKTGSLMRMSLRMACAIANKNGKIESSFKEFAENIGMAFQIRDDALDLNSKDKKFGKTYGNDITEGKISLPVVFTLKSVGKKKRDRLIAILAKHSKDRRLIKEAIKIIEGSNSIEKSMRMAKKLIDEAWEGLENNWKDRESLEKLRELTYFFVERNY